MSYDFTRLPKPSPAGHYWWGEPGTGCPAILKISGLKPFAGFYMVSARSGVLFDGAELQVFAKPEQALVALRRAMVCGSTKMTG